MKKSLEIFFYTAIFLTLPHIRQVHAGDVSFKNQTSQNNTNQSYQDWLTVLYRAAQETNIEDMHWDRTQHSSIENNPNVRSPELDSDITTLLQRAIRQSSIRSMYSLIRQGIDSNLLSNHALTLIRVLLVQYQPCYMDIIRNLVVLQKNIHILDEQGQSLLHLAARYADASVVNYLFTQGMDIDARNREGQTFVHQAMQNPDIRVLCHIITEHPQVINLADSRGETPAHLAARIGTVTILRHCQGIDFTIQNPRWQTPLDVAIQVGRPQEIIDVITTLMPRNYPRATPSASPKPDIPNPRPLQARLICQESKNTTQVTQKRDAAQSCYFEGADD